MHIPSSLPRRIRALIPLLALAVGAAACSSEPLPPTAEELASEASDRAFAACQRLTLDIAETFQGYVDEFAPVTETDDGDLAAEVPAAQDLDQAATEFRRRRQAIDCDGREFQLLLTDALDGLDGSGPVGRAVVAEVRDAVLETPGPAATVEVLAGEDLADAVHGAGPRALIELGPGRHVLDEPLALLRDTRLVGRGPAATTIVSTAEGAVVVQLGDGTLDVEGVGFAHEGDAPASVLLLSTGGYDLRDVVVRGGVANDGGSTGYGIVLGGGGAVPSDAVQSLDEVVARDNGAGGVIVVGRRAPELTGVTVADNASCGLCYLDGAGGTVTGGTASGNDTGVLLSGDATPTLVDLTVTDNSAAGIIAEGTAAGEVVGATVTGNGLVGIGTTGTASLVVRDSSVSSHEEVALLAEGSSTPRYDGLTLDGSALGVLVREQAAPTLVGLVITDVGDAHVVFSAETGGSLTGGSCGDDVPGVVLLDASTAEVGETPCDTLDQRD